IELWGSPNKQEPKILCLIYTYHKKHYKVKVIRGTWASRCNGMLVFSDQDDNTIPTHKINHEGAEEYQNIWQKIRAIWKHVHHWYRDDYEWFLVAGDDTYFLMENLRKYLLSKEITAASEGLLPMYLGRRMKQDDGIRFNAGGPGYILNRKALAVLIQNMDDARCQPHASVSWEDVQVAKCLALSGVLPYDTRDKLGRERFHPFSPGAHFAYRIPPPGVKDWYPRFSFDLKEGRDCCAPDSISFHYVNVDMMSWLHHQLYTCR
ncbi:unnamed protein product, partial [Chrysoparadoxa australica]